MSNTSSRIITDPRFDAIGSNPGISRKLRKQLKWTQKKVAAFTGYSLKSVQGWDQNYRNIPVAALEKLMKAAGKIKQGAEK